MQRTEQTPRTRAKLLAGVLAPGLLPLSLAVAAVPASAQDRPNILVIMGDDIGMWNVGAYTHGMMGRTPNIDRIADEGMLFTDHYAQPSCTAGRAAFITGQLPIRTGMTTIGIPGSTLGLQPEDPTLAEVLKPLGYATGQFGKNHLGDRNEFLPTVHGFDEFYGNLYHLNAEEQPEQLDYPGVKNPEFAEKFGPRGVLHCWATDEDDPSEDPKFGRMGMQRSENTGALTRERMKTVDGEFLDAAEQFIDRSVEADEPFFVWFNPTRMHIWTHVPQEYIQQAVDEGRPEIDVYRAGMLQHDDDVGRLLQKLDDLGITDDTIVLYTTDNGYELLFWPDGGYSPFRGEKGTTWEGGVRVPMLARWPGKIPAGSAANGIQSHEDLFVTLAAAAGAPDIKEQLLAGSELGDTTYQVHLDGENNLNLWTGESETSARNRYFYYDEFGPHRRAGRRLEDVVCHQGRRSLVGPAHLSAGAVSLQPADGPDGAVRSALTRVGLHGPQAVRREAVDPDPGTGNYRGAYTEPGAMAAAAARLESEHAERDGSGDAAARAGSRRHAVVQLAREKKRAPPDRWSVRRGR